MTAEPVNWKNNLPANMASLFASQIVVNGTEIGKKVVGDRFITGAYSIFSNAKCKEIVYFTVEKGNITSEVVLMCTKMVAV